METPEIDHTPWADLQYVIRKTRELVTVVYVGGGARGRGEDLFLRNETVNRGNGEKADTSTERLSEGIAPPTLVIPEITAWCGIIRNPA